MLLQKGVVYKINYNVVKNKSISSGRLPLFNDNDIVMVISAKKVPYKKSAEKLDIPWITEHYTLLCKNKKFNLRLQENVNFDKKAHKVSVWPSSINAKTAIMTEDYNLYFFSIAIKEIFIPL